MSKLEEQLLLKIESAGLPLPEREYKFHPKRRWRFDLAYPMHMLAVEVEGGIYSAPVKCHKCGSIVLHKTKMGKFTPVLAGGRHNRAGGFEGDAEKYNAAALLGWQVLRVTGKMIKSGAAVDIINEALSALGTETTYIISAGNATEIIRGDHSDAILNDNL